MNEKEKESLREMRSRIDELEDAMFDQAKEEKEELRKLSSRIDEMLSEGQEEPRLLGTGTRDEWLQLWEEKDEVYLRNEHTSCRVYVGEVPITLLNWLGDLLRHQRPRVYKTGDALPERYLWWNEAGHFWSLSEGPTGEWNGLVWLPLPPDYEAPEES